MRLEHVRPQAQFERFRPQAVGAGQLQQFQLLAPKTMGALMVLHKVFHECQLERWGWKKGKTELDDLGVRSDGSRKWRVRNCA